jgi:hypothetical protein
VTDQNEPPAKSPVESAVEHAVEALVYAPIGLLFEGASILPQLVEKGRNQVTMARMLGQFAVQQGREEATKAAGKLQDQAAGVLDFIGGTVTPIHQPEPVAEDAAAGPRPSAPLRPLKKQPGAARAAARKVAGATAATEARAATPKPSGRSAKAAPAPASKAAAGGSGSNGSSATGGLAIPDYDGLSASHVVNRLEGLSADELEAVRRYEAAHRGRTTILSKVAQLQSA